MNKSIHILNPEDLAKWDSYIHSHDDASLYHSSLWKDVVEKTYGYEPVYFTVEDDQSNIIGGLPVFHVKSIISGKRLVSLPFSDHCDLLLDNDDDSGLLVDAVTHHAEISGISNIEFKLKNSGQYFDGTSFARTSRHLNHLLVLEQDPDSMKKIFHKSVSRNVNKSLESDLTLSLGAEETNMKIFYELYVLTRKLKGLPPQPYSFFRNMWNVFRRDNRINVWLAYYRGLPVSGIVTINFKQTMYYLYGGLNREYTTKRPSYFLLWSAIEHAIQTGLKYFDFGRTSVENTGLLDFKRRWGTQEINLEGFSNKVSHSGQKQVKNHLQRTAVINKIIRVTPTPLLKLGGRLIYRHLG